MCKGRDDDDFALLEAWRRGDRVAGAVLFERHYECVARFFHNKVSEEAQEDLLHDTFEGCLKAVARFRGQARFRNFLFAIARNVLIRQELTCSLHACRFTSAGISREVKLIRSDA